MPTAESQSGPSAARLQSPRINRPAAASGAHKPIAPVGDRHFGTAKPRRSSRDRSHLRPNTARGDFVENGATRRSGRRTPRILDFSCPTMAHRGRAPWPAEVGRPPTTACQSRARSPSGRRNRPVNASRQRTKRAPSRRRFLVSTERACIFIVPPRKGGLPLTCPLTRR
jgi:hypothetical protein